MMTSYYWLGLERIGSGYYISDGTFIGNGYVSNANPYAHFTYFFQDWLTGQQGTKNCTLAHVTYTYDMYKGSPSNYLQMQTSTMYTSKASRNKWVAVAGLWHSGCEINMLQGMQGRHACMCLPKDADTVLHRLLQCR